MMHVVGQGGGGGGGGGLRAGGWAGVNNWLPEHNSETVRNILMIHGGIIEQVNAECRVQEQQLSLSSFSNYIP